jgi:general secretion pathway protein F
MPVYEYLALDKRGAKTKGTVDAENVRSARQKLRGQGIFATEIKEALAVTPARHRDLSRFFQTQRVGVGDLAVATRQFATLIGAGLPLVDSLQALSEQVESAVLKRVLVKIRENIQEGISLTKSLAEYPKTFPRLFVNMVRAGEASGTLEGVLMNLADYLEAQQELRRKVITALFYPALMLFVCIVIVIVLLTYAVPTIVDIFIKQGAELPLPTKIMIGISHFLTGYWWLLIAMGVLAVASVRIYYQSKPGRERLDRLFLRLPILGGLFLKINTARITGTLGTLLSNGVGLLDALEIVRNIVSNVHLARAIENARIGVQEGQPLAKELSKSKEFPPLVNHMVAAGETSGRLETMLVKAGKSYENEVNALLAGLTSLIEPIMMIVLGMIVISIVISILLPMVDLINVIKR